MHYANLYVNDVATVKQYGNKYKLTLHKSLRQKGFDAQSTIRPKGSVNDKKLKNNISRAKNKVFEYAMCNEFEYFVTLTIDKDKFDRNDLKFYYEKFGNFLKNYNRNHECKVQYIFIPERHKDGAWHMHGLIKGIPKQHLSINEYGYLDWQHYRDRFGFVSLGEIKNQEACCKYITKYVCKDLADSVQDVNARLYYCSKGLNKAVELKKGRLLADSLHYDFENEHVKIKWFSTPIITKKLID